MKISRQIGDKIKDAMRRVLQCIQLSCTGLPGHYLTSKLRTELEDCYGKMQTDFLQLAQ